MGANLVGCPVLACSVARQGSRADRQHETPSIGRRQKQACCVVEIRAYYYGLVTGSRTSVFAVGSWKSTDYAYSHRLQAMPNV